MASVIWKTKEGRARLEAWYERFRADIGHPTESRVLDTAYGPSHVLVSGPPNATPLVCLHPMRTGAPFLLSSLAPLLQHYRVYAPDLPGQSIRGLDARLPLDDDTHARWLAGVLDGLHVESANFVGASWGGFIARLFASESPARVRKLALVVPAGIANGSHVTGIAKMLWPMIRYRLRSNEANLRRLLSPIMSDWDERWASFLADSLRDMKIYPKVPPLASDDELRKLTMPTLLLVGDQDISFPAERIRARIASVRPDFTVEVMRDCKHTPPSTEAFRSWICARLCEFFGGLSPRVLE